jgi:hypothetical protein
LIGALFNFRLAAIVLGGVLMAGCARIDSQLELIAPFESVESIPPFVSTSLVTGPQAVIVISSSKNVDELIARTDLHHLYLIAIDCRGSTGFETIASWYPMVDGGRTSVAEPSWVSDQFEIEADPKRFYYVAQIPRPELQMMQDRGLDCLELRAGAMWGLGQLSSDRMPVGNHGRTAQP